VCERWTNGGEHMRRKRVAESIIRCAKTGNRCLGALVEAGERAVVRPPGSQDTADAA
jgi:hypothetical protein